MFDGFAHKRIKTSGTEIALVQGGNGPPLLLVHGYPQSHVMWHKVAPRLAQRFTVVAPDLRGYGASGKPPTDAEHLPYSKRAMALDLVEVMTALGFDRFDIVGHDRGARVTYRLALDHPERVRHAAVLDIIPTIEQFERMDRNGARAAYHWFFLAQPAPFPETLIGKDPDYFIEYSMQTWCGTPGAFTPEAMAAYREAFRDPAVIHAQLRRLSRGHRLRLRLRRRRSQGREKDHGSAACTMGRARPAVSWRPTARYLEELGARPPRRLARMRAFHRRGSARRPAREIIGVPLIWPLG